MCLKFMAQSELEFRGACVLSIVLMDSRRQIGYYLIKVEIARLDELYPAQMEKYFQTYEIKTTGYTYTRINGKSYRDNPNVSLSALRYLKVRHYNFARRHHSGACLHGFYSEEKADIAAKKEKWIEVWDVSII